MTYKTQHAKVVRMEISIGKEHGEDERTVEAFIDSIREALTSNPEVGAHNVTVNGAYYILDGKVCLPADYDPAQKDRKPGTYPPSWAGGPEPSKTKAVEVVEDDAPREFVRVKPTKSNERGPSGRRVRSDKGVKKGPRTVQGSQEKAA